MPLPLQLTDSWRKSPRVFAAEGFDKPGIQSLFFEGPSFKQNPTRVFALYGLPKTEAKPVPGIVLVHGGGGTAFADWIRLWNDRGYAAIAVDTCGGVPCWTETPYYAPEGWPRHSHSGPNGWGVDFSNTKTSLEDEWAYHAVAAVLLGTSLLCSLPQVDASRIGLTGISWGAVLACIAAGLDPRYKCVVPVYGCGFLDRPDVGLYGDHSSDSPTVKNWLERWDPRHYLPAARMPFLWINGTNDFAFPLQSLSHSVAAKQGDNWLSIPVRMPHGHGGIAERATSIHCFMDWALRGKCMPPRMGTCVISTNRIFTKYDGDVPPHTMELAFTRATGFWTDRHWNVLPATFDPTTSLISATLPPETTSAYLNATDTSGNLWSSPLTIMNGALD